MSKASYRVFLYLAIAVLACLFGFQLAKIQILCNAKEYWLLLINVCLLCMYAVKLGGSERDDSHDSHAERI